MSDRKLMMKGRFQFFNIYKSEVLKQLERNSTDVEGLLGTTQSAVSKTMQRGEKLPRDDILKSINKKKESHKIIPIPKFYKFIIADDVKKAYLSGGWPGP